MLRVLSRAKGALGAVEALATLGLPRFASLSSVPSAANGESDERTVKAEVRENLERLPQDDPWVKIINDFLLFSDEVDQAVEAAEDGSVPNDIPFTDEGVVDVDEYIDEHDMVPELAEAVADLIKTGVANTPPREPKSLLQAYADYKAELKPLVEKTLADLEQQKTDLEAKLAEMRDLEERAAELTVDEVLEKNPDIAQEIKDEIERHDFEVRDYGYRPTPQVSS